MKSVIFVIGCLVALTAAQRRPPNYSQDEMPDTSFDCRDKVVGGYYADIETDCQMFHVCVKVPGLGIQDYRFLCPNDTTFDQENQICANWYDIDCEASTLYYSDNFDLYRIDKGSLPSSKGTPIPLGPSTQRPPAAPAKKRPLIQKQDEEEEFYLQRSETGDRRLQSKDLLRGSSSGNFFNKNQGKEDDFDDNYQSKDAVKPSTSDVPRRRNNPNNANNNSNKKKVAVRKLRKRPDAAEIDVNAQQSYQAAPTTSPPTSNTQQQTQQQTTVAAQNRDQTDRYYNRQNNRQSFNNQKFNTQNIDSQKSSPSSTTFKANPTTEAAIFDKTTRNQQFQQPRYNTINRNANTQASPSTTQPPPTTFNQPSSNNNNNNYFQSRNNRPAFDASRGNTNFAKSTTQNYDVTKAPTTKKYVDIQPRGFEVQKTNTVRNSAPVVSTTVGYTTFNNNNNNNGQNFNNNNNNNNNFQNNNNNNFAKSTSFNSVSTTYAPVTFSGNYRQNNAFAKITTQKVNPTDYQDYNGNYDSYGNQRENGNNGQPQTSDEYVENARDVEKEFLKTAPSNNIRPSNFNNFAKTYTTAVTNNYNNNNNNNNGQNFNSNNNNQKATTNFNYEAAKSSSKTDFNAGKSSSTNFNNNQNNNFRSQSSTQTQFAATNAPTTRRPSTQYYQPSSSQYNNNNNQSPTSVPVVASSTTYSPPKAAPTSAPARNFGGSGGNFQQSTSFRAVPSTTVAPPPQKFVENKKAPARPTEVKKTVPIKDASYDYAYYDDTDGTEYEGTDPISDHHFGKSGDSLKIRS